MQIINHREPIIFYRFQIAAYIIRERLEQAG